jgi:hypothetical protein
LIVTAAALLAVGCATVDGMMGWTTLVDGDKGLENFDRLGDANWRAEGGAIVADKATENSYLVTRESYRDFKIHAEFWADTTTNSGIFIRVTDPQKITATSSYEVNIWDDRPEKDYATGAIVGLAKVDPMPKTVGQWSVMEITAKDGTFTVVVNGQKTVDGAKDTKHASGRIALQHGLGNKDASGVANDKGVIKFRKVEIKAL